MSAPPPNATPKTHPATREILPDDPMQMHGFEMPGDPGLMLRLLVEEYARIGWSAAAIMQLARDPNYQAFHGLLKHFGEDELAARVGQILARCGVMRVKTTESPPIPTELVQLDLSQPAAVDRPCEPTTITASDEGVMYDAERS